MQDVVLLIAAMGLVVLNGFFVAAEFSLVKLRQTRIRSIAKTHGWRGRMLAKVHARLDTYLSACQLGITLASLGLGWVGEPAFADLLNPLLTWAGVAETSLADAIAFTFAFCIISFLHIVIGELAPKSIAIRYTEQLGLWTASPLYGFYWLMYPAIWLLNASANLVLLVTGLRSSNHHDNTYTADELKMILRATRSRDRFSRDEWNILAKTLDFSELEVSDLMRPIHELVAMHRNKPLAENLATAFRSQFSRYPYFDNDNISILGVIHLKDLFFAQQNGKSIVDLEPFLRPIQYITPQTPALELFRRFSKGAPHFAVIGAKGKKPQGFITLDNLLSAMVGEIRDEFRSNANDWTRLDDDTLIGKGSLPIFSLERILGLDIENEELDLDDVDSVGGLIMAKLQDIPEEGQKIEFNGFDIVVKKMSGPRIVLVRVYPRPEENMS
ncbi:MAG: hypothetical protein CTY29_01855 [Methylobacter sp.]|nr:MAG: hypothetical protein CTY29_01855 [Methylobacter sp.]PPD23051.1 MAG: hypothetical protein CTY24_05805 [Methylobacter sp.]PPD36876.1 MAG: hypothetical protein CTY18_03590 [Methylomonas sp.]